MSWLTYLLNLFHLGCQVLGELVTFYCFFVVGKKTFSNYQYLTITSWLSYQFIIQYY